MFWIWRVVVALFFTGGNQGPERWIHLPTDTKFVYQLQLQNKTYPKSEIENSKHSLLLTSLQTNWVVLLVSDGIDRSCSSDHQWAGVGSADLGWAFSHVWEVAVCRLHQVPLAGETGLSSTWSLILQQANPGLSTRWWQGSKKVNRSHRASEVQAQN